MESLYRKYRPLTFDSVVGQQHIVSTLEHAITEGRLSHAYLFCGPRGTGKTTMARILAKALLCRNAEAARAEGASGCMPDGTCEECELIAEGNHPDVYELDAASRTGVDNVREEIINSVNFAPVRGKYKIYIIDEVHMLTTAAFNALLKTLEEPPAHVIFVLCTTDPQKILETILSRCQRFDFHRIGNEDIEHRLAYVCEQEGFDYDDEALAIVARHAKGGMRDALSTLEQLSVFGNGTVHADDARSLLGEVSDQILGEFSRATADDGSKLTVSFPAGSTFAIKMLGRADTQSVVLPTVSAVFGRRTVDYVLDGGGTPAPQHEEHSPSARAAVSADPQPVSSAAPVSSSAGAPQQQTAPVATSTPSAPKPAAPKPAAPAPAPKPVAPASKSSDLGKAPWLRSDNPAGAPATGKLPTEPAPRAPERASASKAQPAAPSAPWESEQVPYDDAMVGGFAADAGGDDLPPFDVPGAASAPKSAATAPKEEDAPAAPWESNPGAGSPFGHQGAAPSIPQTEDEAKALIRNVFGQATIFKPVE